MDNKRSNLLIGSAIAVFLLFCTGCTGDRSGLVIDGLTDKPIEKAVVFYRWEAYCGIMGFATRGTAANYETLTNKEGKYFVPSQRFSGNCSWEPRDESLVVYKDGYAGYIAHSERDNGFARSLWYVQKCEKRNNLVKLYPWKEGCSTHKDNYDLVWGQSWNLSPLLTAELEKEKIRTRIEEADGQIVWWQKEVEKSTNTSIKKKKQKSLEDAQQGKKKLEEKLKLMAQ